jgi:acyl carrier protein
MTGTLEAIRRYIVDNIAWNGDPNQLSANTHLLDGGVLDSVAIVGMVSFLEDAYDVEISEDDISLVNFETMTSIARMIDQKLLEGS